MASGGERCIVIGAGPAGLTAAWELARGGESVLVIERDAAPGGLSRTLIHRGYRCDIGGHRFFTREPPVLALWKEWMGEDLLLRPRLSRIYYRGRFFDYPLRPVNALARLGPADAFRVMASYLAAAVFPSRVEDTFEQWVCNRFGRRLFEIFFRTYTEKVWGMPCSEISSDWARQRIRDLDLWGAVRDAFAGRAGGREPRARSLAGRFWYPRLGPGMMWERCAALGGALGAEIRLNTAAGRVRHESGRIVAVASRGADGAERTEPVRMLLSSMPVRELVHAMEPAAPPEVMQAAGLLRHRDFMTVLLVVKRADLFPDNWIYVHGPEVRVGRIQNFKNWSPDMVPDPATTALGLEYFLQAGEPLWETPDADLVAFAAGECERVGLIRAADVADGAVFRARNAYPVYDMRYRTALATVRSWLDGFANLRLIGRSGQHRYDNQDCAMLSALRAVQSLREGRAVPGDDAAAAGYLEEGVAGAGVGAGESAASEALGEETIRAAFARYDPVALGAALGVSGSGLLLAASVPVLLRGGEAWSMLALLGNYLWGYAVTWPGVLLGCVETAAAGFGFGFLLASGINALVAWHETLFRRRLEMLRATA